MIEDYFNLTKAPFRLSTDAEFYYDSARHRKALSYLQYGLQQAEGVVVVAGEAGVGKSMLIERLLLELEGADALAATISPGPASQDEIFAHILAGFRIEANSQGKVAQIEALREFLVDQLEAGRQVLLIVDEAQNLSADAIEEIRQLTNYTSNGSPLVQVFLVGQPALTTMLALPEMEQLRQRVIASCDLQPLNADETANYIEHRMTVSGWGGSESVFTDVAHKEIHKLTGGVPRKVNTLCTRFLLQVALDKKDFVNLEVVTKVVADLEQETIGQLNHKARVDGDVNDAIPDNAEIPAPDAAETDDLIVVLEPDNGSTLDVEDAADNIVPFQQTGEAARMPTSIEDQPPEDADNETNVSKKEATTGAHTFPAHAANASLTPVIRDTTSVLDRLGGSQPAEALKVEPDQGSVDSLKDQSTDNDAEPVSLEQLAEQIAAEVEVISDSRDLPEANPPNERLEGMKVEMQNLVNEVQEGLLSVENNMTVLRDRLSDLEQHRSDRNTLIVDHLQQIDDALKAMAGEK